jgi:predicted cupin superfamily sugar epimerase
MSLNADSLIQQLQLEPHAEGGWFRRISLSNTFIPAESLLKITVAIETAPVLSTTYYAAKNARFGIV